MSGDVIRSFRALLMFWTIFLSYAVQWCLAKLSSRFESRWSGVHELNANRLTDGFTRLRGIFIKLGQVLSVIGGFLPREYSRALARLQDEVPGRPFDEVIGRLTSALGPDALNRFKELEETPLAAASLAQVHRGVTADGKEVAVKVLYPGIERLIRRDLAVLRSILPVVRRLFPIKRFERVLDQLAGMLARETDYANERSNIARMRKIFDGVEGVVIPQVVDDLSGAGVLTMSFERGKKITDFAGLKEDSIDREAVAKMLVDCYFKMLFSARVFHADPHPGNFLVRPGPELIILDHGAVEEVTDALAEGMKGVVLGAMAQNDEQILEGLETMGFVSEDGDRDFLAQVGRDYMKALGEVQIDDFSTFDRDTVEKLSGMDQTRGKLRQIMKSIEYPEGYFYVERTLVLLFGLIGQLAPKKGLPGLIGPDAMMAFAAGMAPTPPASDTSAEAAHDGAS